MAKRFSDADRLLNDLLDRSESGISAPTAYPDREAFPDVKAMDVFEGRLRAVEATGAISLVNGTGRRRGELKLVRLSDAGKLASLLGREASTAVADRVELEILTGLELHPPLREASRAAAAAWSRRRSWYGVSVEDAPAMRVALRLAQAIVDGQHVGLDYRTFSKRIAGHSKWLERTEALVVRLVGTVFDLPADAPPRAVLAHLGVERFGPPLIMAGLFEIDGIAVGAGLSYVGMPPEAAARIGFPRLPDHVLTIENLASFNRHVAEADPDRLGLTIYVGGYPSRSMQGALAYLDSSLPSSVPFFHWSDIDVDGTWIFRTIERVVRRPLRPHLMSRDLAERHGIPGIPNVRLKVGAAGGSGIADLVDYLAGSGHRTLEQEEIDPILPHLVRRMPAPTVEATGP